MICAHASIRAKRTGQQDTCLNCGTQIIYDGNRWRWAFDIDAVKRRKLITAFNVDRITGAHD